jgi:hypothetical protein
VELAAGSPVGGGFRLENLPPAASAGRSQISTEYANVSERLDLPRLLGGSSKLVRERRRGIRRQRDAEDDVAVAVPCVDADEPLVLAVFDGPRDDSHDLDPDAEQLIAFEFDDGSASFSRCGIFTIHLLPPSGPVRDERECRRQAERLPSTIRRGP